MSDNNGMVNIIAPDGSAGQVPAANAQAALNAGGRIGVHVYAPDGTPGFIPHDQLPAATKAGATATPSTKVAPDAINNPVGFGQSVSAPIPAMASGLYHNLMDAPRDAEEARVAGTSADSGMIAQGLGHIGLAGYRTLIAPAIAAEKTAEGSVAAGHPLQAFSEAMEGVPLIGGAVSAGKQAVGQYVNGDKSGAAGTVVGNLLAAGVGARIGAGPETDARLPAITPEEVVARRIAKGVNPATAAYQQFLDAAPEIPSVLDYAKRNGLKVDAGKDTTANLAKLAQGPRAEVAAHYENNFLGPNETVRPGGVTQGELAGSNPTLRQIDDRIRDIAADQSAAVRKPTAAQALGASDLELNAEKAHLADILHRSLGDLTGVGPEDVQALRQRMARLNVLSGETQGAANSVTRSSGVSENAGGSTLPTSQHAVLGHFLSQIPGFDPESLQGKAVLKALGQTDYAQGKASATPTNLPQAFQGANAPAPQNPAVAAFQQQAAQGAALAANTIADQQPVQAAKAAAKVQRTAAQQALVDKYVSDQAAEQQKNNATRIYRRFINTPNMDIPK